MSHIKELQGSPRHLTVGNKGSLAESALQISHLWVTNTSNPLGPTLIKVPFFQVHQEGHLFTKINVVYHAYPLQYCSRVRVQPMPCRSLFTQRRYILTLYRFYLLVSNETMSRMKRLFTIVLVRLCKLFFPQRRVSFHSWWPSKLGVSLGARRLRLRGCQPLLNLLPFFSVCVFASFLSCWQPTDCWIKRSSPTATWWRR